MAGSFGYFGASFLAGLQCLAQILAHLIGFDDQQPCAAILSSPSRPAPRKCHRSRKILRFREKLPIAGYSTASNGGATAFENDGPLLR